MYYLTKECENDEDFDKFIKELENIDGVIINSDCLGVDVLEYEMHIKVKPTALITEVDRILIALIDQKDTEMAIGKLKMLKEVLGKIGTGEYEFEI